MHMWFLAASFVIVPVCLMLNVWIDRRDAARKSPPFVTSRNKTVVHLATHSVTEAKRKSADNTKAA